MLVWVFQFQKLFTISDASHIKRATELLDLLVELYFSTGKKYHSKEMSRKDSGKGFATSLSDTWKNDVYWRSEICKYSGIQDWSEEVKWELGKDTKKWANAMTAQGDSDEIFKWKRVEEKE